MGRKKKTTADELIDVTSMLPWWVGCILAVVSYVILHFIAGTEIVKPTGIQGMGAFAGKQLFVTLAGFGQYVLPILFGFGALISGLKSTKQKKQFEKVQAQPQKNALLDMSWQEFEGVVGQFFKRRGYSVTLTGGNGPDGGVDLVASKGSDKYLVQCKQWKACKVGVQVVRELYGVMSAQGAAGGIVVTAGEFTAEAKKFTEGLNIQLFDGSHLHKMIREMQQPVEQKDEPAKVEPVCPKCGEAMVKRTAKQGKHIGEVFLGCSGFPKCRQIQSLG